MSGRDNIRLGAREGQKSDDEEVNNLDIRYNGWRSANGFYWHRCWAERRWDCWVCSHSQAQGGSQVRDILRNGPRPPGVPVEQLIAGAPMIYSDDSREGETTLKYDLVSQSSRMGKLQAGGAVMIFNINYSSYLFPRFPVC